VDWEGVGGRWWGVLTNVQCKPVWNWHNKSSLLLYNEYILIKTEKKLTMVVHTCHPSYAGSINGRIGVQATLGIK
jgi:aminopeptidase-like protein